MRHFSTVQVIPNCTRIHFCHFHHIGHTFSYVIAETNKINATSLHFFQGGALWQSAEKTSERGKMVVGRVDLLRGESLIVPQSGGYIYGHSYNEVKEKLTIKKMEVQQFALNVDNPTFSELSRTGESSIF